jgi:hypothetical protein
MKLVVLFLLQLQWEMVLDAVLSTVDKCLYFYIKHF